MATIEKRKGKKGISYRVKIRRQDLTLKTATFSTLEDAQKFADCMASVEKVGKIINKLANFYIERHDGKCDVVWRNGKPFWGRSIPKGGRATICANCRFRIPSTPVKPVV